MIWFTYQFSESKSSKIILKANKGCGRVFKERTIILIIISISGIPVSTSLLLQGIAD
mgnify:FL=1